MLANGHSRITPRESKKAAVGSKKKGLPLERRMSSREGEGRKKLLGDTLGEEERGLVAKVAIGLGGAGCCAVTCLRSSIAADHRFSSSFLRPRLSTSSSSRSRRSMGVTAPRSVSFSRREASRQLEGVNSKGVGNLRGCLAMTYVYINNTHCSSQKARPPSLVLIVRTTAKQVKNQTILIYYSSKIQVKAQG